MISSTVLGKIGARRQRSWKRHQQYAHLCILMKQQLEFSQICRKPSIRWCIQFCYKNDKSTAFVDRLTIFSRVTQITENCLSRQYLLFTHDCRNRSIPQGSVVGPVLFSLYINNFPNILTCSKAVSYADDIVILFTGKTLSEV